LAAAVVARELLDLADIIRHKRLKFEEMGDTEAVRLTAFLEKFVRAAAESWEEA